MQEIANMENIYKQRVFKISAENSRDNRESILPYKC